MSQWYAAPERLNQKKLIASKGGQRPVPVSTITIGGEDFHSSVEEAGHCYSSSSSSQRPPRQGAVHYNMSKAAPPPLPPPRHIVQINKTSPKSDTNNAIAPSSNAGRGKSKLATEAALSRQGQRPSTAGASGEKSSEGKGNVLIQRHSSCDLREDMKSPLLERRRFFPHSANVVQVPLQAQERGSEFGMSMRDMSESLCKIEELIFPSKGGQEVVMRENMAFEAAPTISSEFFDVEDLGSVKPMFISPMARSRARNSDGDVEKQEAGVRKQQRRAMSAVKGRRRKGSRSVRLGDEKSQSCENDTAFREDVDQRWTLVLPSGEFSSSSLPLYGDRSESDSGASNGNDEPSARRRWPKIRPLFSTSASRSETESTTTQAETASPDTSRRLVCRSASKKFTSKSPRSRFEDTNLAGNRTTTALESETENADPGGESCDPLRKNEPLHEIIKRNEGFEEENEVLCKSMYTEITKHEYGDNGGTCSPTYDERAKERDDSSSEESSPAIVPPTPLTVSKQAKEQTRQQPNSIESTLALHPTKEAQEQRGEQQQLSNSVGSSAEIVKSQGQNLSRHHEEEEEEEDHGLAGNTGVSKLHVHSLVHGQTSESYYEDSSTVSSESSDEKRLDVDLSGARHQESGEEPGDVIDARCGKSCTLKMCAYKSSAHVHDKASITQTGNNVHASLSTEKLCSILLYLGQVERSDLQEPMSAPAEKAVTPRGVECFFSPRADGSPRAVLDHAEDAISLTSSSQTALSSAFPLSVVEGGNGGESRASDTNPAIAATTIFDGVRKKVQELRHKISEQETKIGELQAENEKLVREREKHMTLEREKYYKQLEDQAAEFKVIIQHHLSVNEKMLRDKEQLTEKCCNLAGILSVAESKFDENLKQLSEQSAREMKKAKELWAVGEKQRQRAWQEKKLKDLKETAIRGLEPHLDTLNDKHRHDIAKMEAQHAEDLQSKLDAQNLDHRRQMSELRDHLQQERDKMLDNERLAAHARVAEVAERFEQQAIQQRIRVAAEITAQLERSEAGRREDKNYSQELLARLHKEASEREEALRKQMDKKVEETTMKKDRQIEQLKSQMVATAEHLQQKINYLVAEAMRDREKELRTKLTTERDEQIELVIERLESEKEVLVAQMKEEAATKVNEIVAEKLEVELELKEHKSKLAALGDAIRLHERETQQELQDAEKRVAALREEIRNQTRVIEELHDQAAQHDTELRNQGQAFEARLKDEQSRLKQTMLDLNKSNSKAHEMRTRKVEELAEVEARVRKAIVKKDDVIANLREQLLSAHRQIKATEYLIQREHNAFISES